MNVAVPLIDVLALVGFSAAFVFALAIPAEDESLVSRVGKLCYALAMAVYVFAMFSNVLEHTGLTSALDVAEDYLEVLFPPLVLYAIYSVYVRQRERELLAAQRAAQRSQDMLLGILDAAPAGILVLDAGGRVTFANDTAKAVLDLTESAGGTFSHPGWVVAVEGEEPRPDFARLIAAEGERDVIDVVVEWPTGWKVELHARAEALSDSAGRLGGVVATFLPPAGFTPRNGDA